MTLEITNWYGKTDFEFELDRIKEDKVKVWKKKAADMKKRTLSLEGIFEGNLISIELAKE